MKLLFLANKCPYPPSDGGTIATFGLLNSFANAGHNVTVLAMNTLKHHIDKSDISPEVSSKIDFRFVDVPAPINVFKLLLNFLFSSKPYNAVRFESKKYNKELINLLKSNNFDIVQIEGLYLSPYIKTVKEYSKSLLAYRSHNIEHEIWFRTARQSKGIKRYYFLNLAKRIKTMETKQINTYDLLVPITQRDSDSYTLMGNTKPAVAIPAGIDLQNNDIKFETTKNDLFFIGALDWTPNQEGLIWFFENCWPVIQNAVTDVKLYVAGRNAPKWLIEKTNKSGAIYCGEVKSAAEFMLSHGVMIAPLLSGGGMRVKIIEAMSFKKPIITTTIGCEGIGAEHGQNILISDNANEFVANTLNLLNNEELQRRLSENSFSFVCEFYSNRSLTDRLACLYQLYYSNR